jgi:hypothetical protein
VAELGDDGGDVGDGDRAVVGRWTAGWSAGATPSTVLLSVFRDVPTMEEETTTNMSTDA